MRCCLLPFSIFSRSNCTSVRVYTATRSAFTAFRKNFFDEAAPVKFARTEFTKRIHMLLCSVTDVFFETVLRKFLRCGDHVSVSFHFCNYACRRNGITQCIAVNQAVLHGGNIKFFNGINKNVAAHVIARAMRQSIPVSFGKRLFVA